MQYQNPILRGFNPDPSICRVGQDYYLVTSSFEFFPGIPVYHSTDLVNWRQIGNCIERTNQLPMEISTAGQGIWAPTIRWHQGRFYVTSTLKNYGNFIVQSADPATGWSDPVRVPMEGIDPSLLFDGDRVYYCTNQRAADGRESISMAQVDPDTGALLSEIRPIWHGMSDDRSQKLEAPHVYHIGDWYYLLAAEGGTSFGHMITAARSRSVWGPYTSCDAPLLTNRDREEDEVACSGHGDLFQDHRGNWWVVHLATRPDGKWYSHMGRESFLLPVTWYQDWPRIGDGRSHLQCEGPLWREQQPLAAWQADFSRRALQWLFVRSPELSRYRFLGDRLELQPATERLSDPLGKPTFLALRQLDIDCVAEAEISFSPRYEGSEAGLTIYIDQSGHYTFGLVRRGGRCVLAVQRPGDTFAPILRDIAPSVIRLRIVASKREYALYAASDEADYQYIASVPVLTWQEAGRCFTGTLIGLYAQSEQADEAPAVIRAFCMKPGSPA